MNARRSVTAARFGSWRGDKAGSAFCSRSASTENLAFGGGEASGSAVQSDGAALDDVADACGLSKLSISATIRVLVFVRTERP